MHARVTRYRLRKGGASEFIDLIREKWLPAIEGEEGFCRFEVIQLDSESDEVITIMHFDTAEGSMNALEKAREWVFQHAGHLVDEPSRVVMGDVVLAHPVRSQASYEEAKKS
jgi:heme-degrading monooxygenase HmoA